MKNILANFISTIWGLLLQIACIPFYIKFMGIEGYGLIGFYIMLQAILQAFDFGLGMTMNRTMAYYSVQSQRLKEARDFTRTVEIIYILIGIVAGVLILSGASLIAKFWIKPGNIPFNIIWQNLVLMGILIILQWPFSFYQNALMGLQRQVSLCYINMAANTLFSVGAVLVLRFFSPTVATFFLWQIVVSFARIIVVAVFFWDSLSLPGHKPSYKFQLIKNVRYFTLGMSGITFIGLLLSQIDKIVLSNLFSLKEFGYYVLASTIAVLGPMMFVSALFNAALPRFSALVARADYETLKQLYHQNCQLIAAFILPIMAIFIFFSFDIVLLWTGNIETARNVAPITSVLVVGTAINAITSMPYSLQLAHSWTKLTLIANVFMAMIVIPGIFFMANHYGALGAASMWIVLNAIYMLIIIPMMHRRLMKTEMQNWIFNDALIPLAAAVIIPGVCRWLISIPNSPAMAFISLFCILISAITATVFVSPQLRSLALRQFSRLVIKNKKWGELDINKKGWGL
jgi:O-antigen/teichoic acid export membrane protein